MFSDVSKVLPWILEVIGDTKGGANNDQTTTENDIGTEFYSTHEKDPKEEVDSVEKGIKMFSTYFLSLLFGLLVQCSKKTI